MAKQGPLASAAKTLQIGRRKVISRIQGGDRQATKKVISVKWRRDVCFLSSNIVTFVDLMTETPSKNLSENARTELLRSAPIPRLLWKYALPAVTGAIVLSLYNFVDAAFIGRGVHEYALAGVSISMPIFFFLQGFGMLVGAGSAVRISILLGQQNTTGAKRVLGTAIYMTAFLSALSIVPCYIFMEPLLKMFGARGAVLDYAVEYLSVLLPFNFFGTISFGYSNIMRASGYSSKAMYTMIMSALINVVLDYLFIFVFHWGIAGAAWATVIAMFVSAVFVIVHFLDPKHTVHFSRSCMRPSFKLMGSIVMIGMAPFFMQIAGSLISIVTNRSFGLYASDAALGDLSIAIYGVVTSYSTLIIMFVIGVTQGMQPIVGYNYGAKRMDRVTECFKLAAVINSVVTIIGFSLAMLIPDRILSFFANSPQMMEVGKSAFRIVFWGFALVGFQITVTQFFQSLGYGHKALFMSLTRQLLFLLPGLLLLPCSFGLDGVWMASPIADWGAVLVAVGMVVYHYKYVFPKKMNLQP